LKGGVAGVPTVRDGDEEGTGCVGNGGGGEGRDKKKKREKEEKAGHVA